MQVTDLGGKDGMLFAFDDDTQEQFWMFQTVMPLSIAFFDSRGRVRVVDRHGAVHRRLRHVPGLLSGRPVPRRDRSAAGGLSVTWASALAARSSVEARAPRERDGYAVGGSVNCWPWRETCSVQARPSQ